MGVRRRGPGALHYHRGGWRGQPDLPHCRNPLGRMGGCHSDPRLHDRLLLADFDGVLPMAVVGQGAGDASSLRVHVLPGVGRIREIPLGRSDVLADARLPDGGRRGDLAGDASAGKAFYAAALLFVLSFTARTMDMPMCHNLPIGTHYFWHIFNAAVLFLLVRTVILHAPAPKEKSSGLMARRANGHWRAWRLVLAGIAAALSRWRTAMRQCRTRRLRKSCSYEGSPAGLSRRSAMNWSNSA